MTRTVTIMLQEPASDMSREEILKQVAHLSSSLRNPRMSPDGSRLQFEVPAEEAATAQQHAEHLCALIQRCLRNVKRKVVYRTDAVSHPTFRGTVAGQAGVHMAGRGQVMLEGVPLQLFRYFDTALGSLERHWATHQLRTPTLIPADVL